MTDRTDVISAFLDGASLTDIARELGIERREVERAIQVHITRLCERICADTDEFETLDLSSSGRLHNALGRLLHLSDVTR